MMYLVALAGTALACGSGPHKCTLKLYEHEFGKGRFDTYDNGDHKSLGYQNNRASSIQLTGSCKVELYTGPNFTGQKTTHTTGPNAGIAILNLGSVAFPFNLNDKLQSAKVMPNRRRRRAEGMFESFQERDPLCEWILQDGLDGDWSFGHSKEDKDEEMSNLLHHCEEEFEEGEALDQCKFYVYAVAAFYDDEDLVADLKFDPEMETADTEYMRCGVVTTKVNQAIEDGKLAGIMLIKGTDGEADKFMLEEADFENHPVFVDNADGAIATILSVGAMISMVVANTLVKVCRDFDPVDYHWLLA